ncbi:MAG: site-specific DNA-methyltransferase [Verrucomicrobia bacterium]|nr:site-specific DNA-methyltransferase [Verrucomicrobiota bacterium]
MPKKPSTPKSVETLNHGEDKRKNIPTAEFQSVIEKNQQAPKTIKYPRNTDLDPQLVWRGKDEQDWSDLVVHAPPLYIQEKVHPKVLIDDLLRTTKENLHETGQLTADLFADFNGIPKGADKTEFYQHDQNWSNRMILGDSLQVMASLAEREGLRGKVQCIYFDPPYGIKFNSNFQWSTTSRDVKDGKADHITREPEQVKAFRDTWRDGIHSYLTYLRDRLTVARDLLTDSGSIFVQIGDENVHRVRAVMDEVFGDENFIAVIVLKKTSAPTDKFVPTVSDFIVWYAKSKVNAKYRQINLPKSVGEIGGSQYVWFEDDFGIERKLTKEERLTPNIIPSDGKVFAASDASSSHEYSLGKVPVEFRGSSFTPRNRYWSTSPDGMARARKSGRLIVSGTTLFYKRYLIDFPVLALSNIWTDTSSSFGERTYVVQTTEKTIERCILMATDPGDLVLDPTCGSGTTATVAEQWGRRWITIDTSRVALALARARIMGARYPFYLLADSREGQIKEAEVARIAPSSQPVRGNIRHGFVYERVPHVTLKSIANNAEIDVIWDKWQKVLEPLREKLNTALGTTWQEWEIPRELPPFGVPPSGGGAHANKATTGISSALPKKDASPAEAGTPNQLHAEWWSARIARQTEIDKSIAAKAEFEFLYDKPYDNKKCVRVAGPFTVESLSPHRMLGVDENDELIDSLNENSPEYGAKKSFPEMILENLKTSGVQQAHKEDRITFTALCPWPGDLVCAEGRYMEGGASSFGVPPSGGSPDRVNAELQTKERRAAIFIGPEFGTVQRLDLVQAAREAADANFDVLIACAFNYEAHTTEFSKLGKLPVLKARMNADLHMSDDLKNTGKGNLFVIFGEPDIDLLSEKDGKFRVKVNGVDVFRPQTGEVISDGADGIACWFIDTDYNEESFFVRHAYFLGANDPYSSLKTTLKAEINAEAWSTLHSDTSRPFEKPRSGRIAVKVINHLGDEVMKVFRT